MFRQDDVRTFEKQVLRRRWARWEMRAWCFVENPFEMKGWKSGVSGVMSLVVCVSVKAVTPVVGGTSSLTDGDSASLTCTTASSLSSGVTYEWFLGGVAISGATSSPYTTAVSMSDDGNAYTCKVTFNGVTSDVSSNTVTLTGESKRSI